jgi:elongation factor 1 alpha-like protein
MEEDPTLSALQRLSLQRKNANSVRPDGNQNVAKGIRGLHFGGRAGLAKKNLASLAPDGLPGTAARKDSWNGFKDLDIDQLHSAKGNKRPADLHGDGGRSSSGSTSRPSKLAALAAARSSSGKPSIGAPVSEVKIAEGKPLSKLQQKMQANLLARQQKKHTVISKEEESQLRQREEQEERTRLLHLPSGDPIASLFPTATMSSKQSVERHLEESPFGSLLRANGKGDLAVPGGSPFQGSNHLEAFSRPSPDDVVLKAREGTHLAKIKSSYEIVDLH